MKMVIVTPVRDEEKYIPITIDCMLHQTLKPAQWIIVNDGSTDRTGDIIKRKISGTGFIKYVSLNNRGFRMPGAGVIEAFYEGCRHISHDDYRIIAKLDGDLAFDSDTLERIVNAFTGNPRLGITGGTRYEQKAGNGPFRKALVPKGYVAGAYKFYRRECFEQIGGPVRRAGWDGVDIIRANMEGWETGEIESIKIKHLIPTGTSTGEGLARACQKYGDVSYYMGGYHWYFYSRVIGRSLMHKDPRVGWNMMKGYYRSRKNDVPQESIEFRNYLKKVQRRNILNWFKLFYGSFHPRNDFSTLFGRSSKTLMSHHRD